MINCDNAFGNAFFVSTSILVFLMSSSCYAQDKVDFNRDIRPLLSDRCFICHGPDERANESGLRLDDGEAAIEWQAFVPGMPHESSAIERIASDDESLLMPPPESNLKLEPSEIELFTRWVEQGAKYDTHWSFKPLPSSVEHPELLDEPWCLNEIDAFVLKELHNNGLEPSVEAEKWRWLRRVTLDLTGLPPSPEEIATFEADDSETAKETVVDRLLANPRFGQQQAVAWLDIARYADSFGYQSDLLSPTWPYRDWVVRAFNENLPYDQFITWQIAGDLLPNASRDQILATAFNRLHRQTNEGGSVSLEWQTEYAADRVNTFATAMLGMTMECARCHDHKYDPVSHRDYYNLFAYFNNIDEWGMYHDSTRVPTPSLLLPSAEQEKEIGAIEMRLADVCERIDQVVQSISNSLDSATEKSNYQLSLKPSSHWSLDELSPNNEFANAIENAKEAGSDGNTVKVYPGKTSPANQLIDGYQGKALQLTGDDSAEFPIDGNRLEPWQRYSISLWLNVPNDLDEAVILHRQGGTDVGTFGTRLYLEAGKLVFSKVRFWPGNALAIETNTMIPREEWFHVVIANDGSGTAEGMAIYVNGICDINIIKNRLTKSPDHNSGNGFVLGEQFRTPGFKNGAVDEISFYDRPLTSVEITAIRNGGTIPETLDLDKQLELALSRDKKLNELNLERGEIVKELLEARLPVVETMVMQEMEQARPAHVLYRGEYDAARTDENRAHRNTPSALPPMKNVDSNDRLALAKWLIDPEHPLTSRVAVNRIWQNFFGTGLVGTANDFGLQGALPTHPELLDWLARDFIESGWDLKSMCKQIVLSATYMQDSRCDEKLRRLDPENRLLARGPSMRLSAEMIRDTALLASELLNEEIGGPPVSPYQPPNLWRENNTMTPGYNQSVGVELNRRSLYSVWKRTTPLPNMMAFDATSREACTVQRSNTNTPLQAMVLLNDIQFVEAARNLAEKAILQCDGPGEATIELMFVRLCGRKPDTLELEILQSVYDGQLKIFNSNNQNARLLVSTGESRVNETIQPEILAATTVVAQTILSSDAAIWKR